MRAKVEEVKSAADKELINRLVEIEKEAFGKAGLNHFTLPPFILFGKVFVLYEGDIIAGAAEYFRCWEEESAYLFGFSVKKEFRGKGLGSFFLSQIIQRIKDDISDIYLTVEKDNISAVKLYEKNGFKRVSFEKDFYGKGEHRIVMKKEITN